MCAQKRKVLAVLLIFFVFLFVSDCKKKTEGPSEIKIGAMLPLSGEVASWGEAAKEGIDFAVNQVNSQGGIDGKMLKIIYEDTQAQPERGASAMLKLATIDKVPVVIGDLVSSSTLAAAPIAEQNNVILFSPTASAPKITEAGKFIFRIWPSDLAEGKAIAVFASNELSIQKIAILYIQNDYGISLSEIFEKEFSNFNGNITNKISYKPDETNFRSYLTKIQEDNPEAIYLVSYYKDAALILKQAKEFGISIQFLGTTAIEEPKLFEIAGDAAEGLIYPISSGYDPENQGVIVQDFKENFKKQYGKDPGFVQAQCYDALNMVYFVMKDGNLNGEEIQKGLENLKDYHGISGIMSFDENGDVLKPTIIKIIRDKQFVLYDKN